MKPITVAELIELLRDMPQNATIVVLVEGSHVSESITGVLKHSPTDNVVTLETTGS